MKFCKDLLCVVLLEKVYVFAFQTMECVQQVPTNKNQFGLVAMSADPALVQVAAPHPDTGTVRLHTFEGEATRETSFKAHSTELKAMALNPECTVIATSSVKGTVVRITSLESGALLQELR